MYVYMHKCVEEKCRIARRWDRTRCSQYLKDVGSNSLHSKSQDAAARNKLFRNIRTTTRYVRKILAEECRNTKKTARRMLMNDRRFSELVIRVVKGNAALSDAQGISTNIHII